MADPQTELPIRDLLSQEWFKATQAGKLLIQRRRDTGKYQFYPRMHALGTLSADVEWVQASGRGKIHTYTVVHRTANAAFAKDCPYILAIVELEEGPRLTTRLIDIPQEQLRCDLPVRVIFHRINDEITLPYFTSEEPT